MQVSALVGAVSSALVIGALATYARRRLPAKSQTDGFVVIRYSAAMSIMGWMALLVFSPIVVYSLVMFHEETNMIDRFAGLGVLALLVLSGFYLLLESRSEIEWSEFEIRSSSLWTGQRSIAWTDVSSVKFSALASWFVLTSNCGMVIRVHSLMGGIPSFVGAVKQFLPENKYSRCRRWIDSHARDAA